VARWVELAQEVPGEVLAVLALQLRPSPVATVDGNAAGGHAASAPHLAVIVVEQRIISGQLLARTDIAHGHEHDVASEAHVGLARVVQKQHDPLVLGLDQSHEMKTVGDLDIGVLQSLGQTVEGSRVNNVATLDSHDLVPCDRCHRHQPAPLDRARRTLGRLRRNVA
jgi:hypothetical protein